MSTKRKQANENGLPVSPQGQGVRETSGSSSDTPTPCTNRHDKCGGSASVCGDSDGDSCSITADDSLCSAPATPTHRKFKIPSRRPRTSVKSETKRRVSSASFSHENSRVMELEREMRKLFAERNELSKQLYASKQENTKLEGKVQVAVRDKSALTSQMASLSKHNRDLSRGKKILLAKAFSSVDVHKTRSLEQSLKQANREKRSKQKELEKLNIQMNMTTKQMQEKLLAWLDEREEMEIRIEDLECEVQHLTECHAAAEEENVVLKESLASREEACQSLKDKQTQLDLAYQEKERELCEVRAQLTSEGEQLKQSLHTAQESSVELEQKVTSVQQQLSESSQQITSLQTQLQSVQAELEKEGRRREEVDGELNQCRQQFGEKVDTLEERVVKLSQSNSDLQTQLTAAHSEAETEMLRLGESEKELSECRERLSEVEDKVVTLEERVTKLSQLNSDLQGQLESSRLELAAEKGPRKQAEESLVVSTAQLTDQRAELERIQKEHAGDLEAVHTKCSNLLDELEKAVGEGKEAQALLRTQMSALEADRQKALRTVEEVREREEVTSVQLTQLKKENEELQASKSSALEKLEHAHEELVTLQEQVDGSAEVLSRETAAAVGEQMTEELVEAQSRLTQQEEQSTRVQSEMGKRVHELEEELERMKGEREQLEVAYLDLQEKCRPFQDQIEGLADVNTLLQSQAALARREAQEVSDQFASLVGHQNSRQKIRYVKKIRDENTALKMEIAQLRMELSKQKKQMRRIQNENKAGPSTIHTAKPLAAKN